MTLRHCRIHNKNRNQGFTLVELVVSMALTAILATAVAALMFPVVSIFMNMQKLSRAQLVADTVTETLRKECAAAYVTDVGDVRVVNIPEPLDATVGDTDLVTLLSRSNETLLADIKKNEGGNALVFRINLGYAKAIYWNTGISKSNYESLLDANYVPSAVTPKAVYRLFPNGTTNLQQSNMPIETRPGYLHCAYYATTSDKVPGEGEDIELFRPKEAYDYTNPFSVGVYNGFTVKVTYDPLTYDNSTAPLADQRPVYVVANIEVHEKDHGEENEDTLVYTRRAVICFAEDNKKVTEE